MKYKNILNETWSFLENNFKGSEIHFILWIDFIEKKCDTKNCLKQCIKQAWNEWEWFYTEEKEYTKKYIKENYNILLK